jgi:anti-sigma factor RsiW
VPREVVALVSADDFVSAVRVYTDRVNDLLRRGGVPALESLEICETHALALLDAVINAPETVIDLVGWWFARAIEVTSQAGRTPDEDAADEPLSMLAGTANEERVRGALATIPAGERSAVLLRDGYDLPSQAVGVALRRGADSAAELIAAGRLDLVAAYDETLPPTLAGHSGRTTVDVVTLSMLADGTLESPRAAPLRRHVSNCPACEQVVEALARGRRLAAGLPIIAMDDDARDAMIDRIASRAEAVLPSHEAVLRAVDEDHDPGPIVSPVITVIVLVLALALGVGIAVITHDHNGPSAPPPVTKFTPPPGPLFSSAPTIRVRRSHTASAQPTDTTTTTPTHRHTHTATPTTSPSESTSAPAVGTPAISVSPNRGHSGSTVTVTGTGFPPDTTVRLQYGKKLASTTARVDSNGDFVGHVLANALLPGNNVITARDGDATARASFEQTL